MKTYADQLVETLIANGVKRIYGLVGDSLNPVVDAVRRHEGISWVHVRNEEAAAFAAGAESLITGGLAVCAGSCGPGNTHLVQGLYDANRNGSQVLAIASHIPATEIGSKFFQETHPEFLFQECSVYCELVNSPYQGGRILHTAIQHAIADRGVAVLVIPGDVADKEAVHVPSLGAVGQPSTAVFPDPECLEALATDLNKAKKVALFVGAGIKDAHELVMELANKLKSPVGHALGGKEYIQYDNPYDVGMNGLLGYGACYEALHEADFILMIGTDFPYSMFFPENTPIAQIDIRAAHLGRRVKLAHAINGDSRSTISSLLPLLNPRTDRSFLDKMLRKHERLLHGVVDAYTRNIDKHTPIHPEYVASIIDDVADDEAIFTVDTGMNDVWASRYITPNGRRRMLGSWRHGTMANALPDAIGAQSVDHDRQVVAFCGDGGLSMLLGEILTVRLHDLPVKIIVFNNSSLGMVKLEMLVEGLPEYQTDHDHVNFAAIAKGAGIPSIRITDPKLLKQELEKAFATKGPILVDVVTDPNALSMPPSITAAQVKGFAIAAGKTVLEGGVGKMWDMAKSNLRNIPRL